MAIKPEIPSIEKLDRGKPDYVGKLDKGLRRVRELHAQETAQYQSQTVQKYREFVARVRGLDGVRVRERPEAELVEIVAGSRVEEVLGVEVFTSTIERARVAEDAVRGYRRLFEDEEEK